MRVYRLIVGPKLPHPLVLTDADRDARPDIATFADEYKSYHRFQTYTINWRDAIYGIVTTGGMVLLARSQQDENEALSVAKREEIKTTATYFGLIHGLIASTHPILLGFVAWHILTRDRYFRIAIDERDGRTTWTTGTNKYWQ